VAQDGIDTGSEDGGHEPGELGLRAMTDGVDAAVDRAQPPRLQPYPDRSAAESKLEELPAGHVAVLALGEECD
jgi:hypothetical protein